MEIASWPSVRDVAAQLGVTSPYVYQLMRAGRICAVATRLGWLIDPESVDQFRAARKPRARVAC